MPAHPRQAHRSGRGSINTKLQKPVSVCERVPAVRSGAKNKQTKTKTWLFSWIRLLDPGLWPAEDGGTWGGQVFREGQVSQMLMCRKAAIHSSLSAHAPVCQRLCRLNHLDDNYGMCVRVPEGT